MTWAQIRNLEIGETLYCGVFTSSGDLSTAAAAARVVERVQGSPRNTVVIVIQRCDGALYRLRKSDPESYYLWSLDPTQARYRLLQWRLRDIRRRHSEAVKLYQKNVRLLSSLKEDLLADMGKAEQPFRLRSLENEEGRPRG